MADEMTFGEKIDAFAATLDAEEQLALAMLIAGESDDDVAGFADSPPWPGMPALMQRRRSNGFADISMGGTDILYDIPSGDGFADIAMGGTAI